VYPLALGRLRVQGSRAIAVEDTPYGVAAARASGMRTVAIPTRSSTTVSWRPPA
jgi:putative hydrolase of the HAD superfamily